MTVYAFAVSFSVAGNPKHSLRQTLKWYVHTWYALMFSILISLTKSPSGHLQKEEPVEKTNPFGTLKPEIELSDNTFQFPKCQIR